MVIRNCRRRLTNLAMGCIDYKKAYDMIPHSWILKCLKMFCIASNITALMEKAMEKWNVDLVAGNEKLGNVRIRRGNFQGDSLSSLLFVLALILLTIILRKMKAGYQFGTRRSSINHFLFMDDLKLYAKDEKQLDSLVNTVQIFSLDIGMEFGIGKCGILVMKRGRYKKSEEIKLPNDQEIKEINVDNEYKYLEILEADGIKDKEMKEKIRKEYTRRVRQVLKSKLNRVNAFSAINSRAVAVVRYSAVVVHWRKDELQEIDRKTRKLLTMYRTYHPQSDKD